MFKVTRDRLYSGPLSHGPSHIYRARLGNNDLAQAATKDECTARAWNQIASVLAVNMNSVRVGVCADGTVITAREYQRGEVELQYHRGTGLVASLYQTSGSSMGRLIIADKRCGIDQYLRYHVLMHDGMDFQQAVDIVLAGEMAVSTATDEPTRENN